VGGVLAPFLALGVVVLVVSLLGGSEIVTARVRPEAGAASATTRTTTIFLSQPSAGSKDAGSGGASTATTSTSTEGTVGGSDTSGASSGSTGSQPGSTETDATAGDAGSATGSDEEGATYTVVAGDTPYSIAQAFGVSTQDLMDLNSIDDPYDLRIGTVLRIPGR
jgi:LysM repeat protein